MTGVARPAPRLNELADNWDWFGGRALTQGKRWVFSGSFAYPERCACLLTGEMRKPAIALPVNMQSNSTLVPEHRAYRPESGIFWGGHMSKTKCLLATIALLVAAGTVSAQVKPSWSYIEAGWLDFDPDSGVSDNGGFAGGSIGIFNNFHLLAEYDWVGDYSLWNAGVGWHGLLGDPLDLFAEVTWRDVEFDSSTEDFSDSGASYAAGIRWMLGQRFELKGKASWTDFDESDAEYGADALFFLMENRLGLGASWVIGDADTLRLFVRWNFGT